jgi:hypothetical protein
VIRLELSGASTIVRGPEEEEPMQSIDAVDYARQLVEIRGDMALVDAARKIRNCEKNGDAEAAAMWRCVQFALTTLRSPAVS